MEPPSSPCPPRRSLRVTPERTHSNQPSSPPSRRSTTSNRSKKNPSVTPRRFNRFFAPRNPQVGATAQSAKASRTALGDISHDGPNRRLTNSSPIKGPRRLFEGDENGQGNELGTTPDRPSPLKKVCTVHPRDLPDTIPFSSQEFQIPSSPPVIPNTPIANQQPPKPLTKSVFRKAFGSTLRREIDWAAAPHKTTRSGICTTNLQSETAHFYSTADDFHHTYNFDYTSGGTADPFTNPFCFQPCNTNSLAAIGDEEGYIRLVETARGLDPPLFKDYLHFRAHQNAILNLDFSEDDALLATAAGDQTSQIIDMKTQKAITTLWGHRASLRQVKFQPGSGGKVIATSGRDGLIMIWDLRCTPTERPAPVAPSISLGGGITTFEPDRNRKYAQFVHQFQPPMPKNKDGNAPNKKADTSVTALSFLSESTPQYLLSASATGSSVLLWDMRKMRLATMSGQNALVGHATPSNSVQNHRGVLSMSLSSDRSRIYALSRDSTAYVYSTSQLLNEGSRVEALYGLRHKEMIVTTWYHSLAVRPSRPTLAQTELLAVGGVGGRVILFPTNEDYIRGGLAQNAGVRNGVKIYEHGTVLNGGHGAEVSSVAWTSQGELCTASDDLRCRVWREGEVEARAMRAAQGRNDGSKDLRWCSWAEVEDGWDDEEA